MKKRLYHIIIAIIGILVISNCDNGGDCNINNVSYNRIALYSIDNETGRETVTKYSGTLTISLMINGKDSIVVNHVTNIDEIALPICYTQECDTVLIEYETEDIDTLYVGHTNIPYFISLDCGTGMYHKLTDLRYTKNFIDSAAIITPNINFDPHENIKLYIAQ